MDDGNIFHAAQDQSSKFLGGRGLSASGRPTAPERPFISLLTARGTDCMCLIGIPNSLLSNFLNHPYFLCAHE